MPKMKTHSGAKKRFRKTAKGKLRARHSFTSHYLGHKSAKRKRRLGRPVVVAEADRKRVEELLQEIHANDARAATQDAPPPDDHEQ